MHALSSISLWTMLAGWSQVVVLIVTARFVFRYLQETERLRVAAQQQVAAANDQLEAQIRPAIVLRRWADFADIGEIVDRDAYQAGEQTEQTTMQIQNIGHGPALDLVFQILGPNQQVDWYRVSSEFSSFWNQKFVEQGVSSKTPFLLPRHGLGSKLSIRYRSLSGRNYMTVVFINGAGEPLYFEFLSK